jgi:hypothetical protein
MLVREDKVDPNVQGRAGCQFQSPFTNQIYYASVENHMLVIKHYDKHEKGRENDRLDIIPMEVSACFASPDVVCVTVVGFHAGSNDSAMNTYIILCPE